MLVVDGPHEQFYWNSGNESFTGAGKRDNVRQECDKRNTDNLLRRRDIKGQRKMGPE